MGPWKKYENMRKKLNDYVLTINYNVLFNFQGYTRFGRFSLPGFTRGIIRLVSSENSEVFLKILRTYKMNDPRALRIHL